jgi:hypothetical protein
MIMTGYFYETMFAAELLVFMRPAALGASMVGGIRQAWSAESGKHGRRNPASMVGGIRQAWSAESSKHGRRNPASMVGGKERPCLESKAACKGNS